jgi:hypothetical protein
MIPVRPTTIHGGATTATIDTPCQRLSRGGFRHRINVKEPAASGVQPAGFLHSCARLLIVRPIARGQRGVDDRIDGSGQYWCVPGVGFLSQKQALLVVEQPFHGGYLLFVG